MHETGISINGFVCKKNASATDFFFAGLAKPGVISNTIGSIVTPADVMQIPGLNTLVVSMARIDYAPGELDVGFITTANVLISKHIMKGENFVFPRGLVHFQQNNGKVPAAIIAGFNSQLPGVQVIAATLFGATPPVPDNVLTIAFQIDTEEVEKIKSSFAPKK
ncbi:unnamed protein product [Ilex paraguariensis]|uniref:Germin-like protein n=1 Tax=Ilex paraguariensis TaxID=185542 RepID=A0ABC8QQT0_9AQUA